MSALAQHTVWTAFLEASTSCAVGDCMVLNAAGTGFVKATLANRTAAGRDASCIARTAADSTQPAFEPQVVGMVSASITNLGAGSASAIRVSDTGTLERCADDDPDIVGKCDTDGVAMLDFCVNWSAIIAIAGGGFLTAPVAGIVTSDGATLLSTTTSAGIRAQLSDETGTGSMVFATSPSLVTPDIGAATGTSLTATSFVGAGSNVASTGPLRIGNNQYLYARNQGNTGNIAVIGTTTGNNINVGGDASQINLAAGTGFNMVSRADAHQFYDGTGSDVWLSAQASRIGLGVGLLRWDASLASAPTLKQDDQPVNNSTGATLSIQAQNCTGTTSTGGGLIITTGTGTSTAGTLVVQTGGTVKMIISPSTTTFSSNATMVNAATSYQVTGNSVAKVYSDIASVQTTDATVTSAFTWTITDEAVTMVTVEACAVQSTGATTASYVRRCRIKRDGGTVTVGTVTDVSTDEEAGFSTCDITIDNSTSTGRIRVTGVAATTIDWGVVVTRLEVAHQ